jgi:uncharacterized protein (DUF305 family)
MKKEALIYGLAGVLVGGLLVWLIAALAVNNNNQAMMGMMGMRSATNSQGMMDNHDMSMNQMSASLQDKTSDAFDEAFLSGMIAHHQGAIDMAELVKANAKHSELKTMADDILSAQSKEIDQMQTWQTEWGYKTTPQSHMMSN